MSTLLANKPERLTGRPYAARPLSHLETLIPNRLAPVDVDRPHP